MLLKILVLIASVVVFAITFAKMFKKNRISYIYIMCIEFAGILISFLNIIVSKKQNMFQIVVSSVLGIIIPIVILLLEKKDYYIDEVLYYFIQKTFYKKDKKGILLELVEKHPKSYMAHKTLAELYEENGELEKAENEYISVVRIKPEDYKSFSKLAKIFDKNGKRDMAIETMQSVLNDKPEYLEGSLLLGQLLYEDEKFKEAILVYNEALKYNPGEYFLYYSLGMTYVRLNDFQNAKDCYKKAATINSIKDISNLNLGQISLLFKDYDKAEKYFFKTMDSADEKISANSYYYLAKIKLLKDEEQMAIQYANLALDLYPKIADKIEKDEVFTRILGKINLKKNTNKRVQSKITRKDEEIIDYLANTNNVVERLTLDFSKASNKVEKNREI